MPANVENLTLTGLSAINGTGNTLNNLIIGNSRNNTLSGEGGNDTIDGGAGNDTLNGGTGNNTYLFGKGDGQDTIYPYRDSTAGKLNTLQFKAGVLPSEVVVKQVYNDQYGYQSLKFSIAGTTDSV
ncbi:MAG: calcium-binding protein, partial [Microcystis sp.]